LESHVIQLVKNTAEDASASYFVIKNLLSMLWNAPELLQLKESTKKKKNWNR
jgi:hypothetical protein